MSGNVAEGDWVSINVQSPDTSGLLILPYLLLEELREVGRSYSRQHQKASTDRVVVKIVPSDDIEAPESRNNSDPI